MPLLPQRTLMEDALGTARDHRAIVLESWLKAREIPLGTGLPGPWVSGGHGRPAS